MSSNLTYLNITWFWPVLICWVALLLVFFWKEWSQAEKKRLILKTFLAFLAVSSLALIALKPAIQKKISQGNVLILTHGFKQNKLDSLKEEYRKIKVIDYRDNKILPELKTSKQIFLLGSGIRNYDLYQFENLPVTYFPGDSAEGIIKLNYDQENRLGDKLQVKGRFLDPKPGNRLVLQDAGGNPVDSINFSSKEHKNFNLATELKVAGNYVFNLTEKDSLGRIIDSNPLPVEVEEDKSLRILILNSFPTFEIKYLKNFLAESGHEVVVKNRITAGRFKFEFFNTERTNLGRLNTKNLEDFDLLILDAGAIRNLSSTETSTLQNSIREEGLGLFILGEANALNSLKDFSVFKPERGLNTEIILDNFPGISLEKQPYQIMEEFGLEEIHGSNSSILSAYKRLGQGRIGTTLLENTWQLQLEGKHEVYQEIWSELVDELSKRTFLTVSWKPETRFLFKDEPFDFHLRTSVEDPGVSDENGHLIPLKQDLINQELWSGKTYPRDTGWQELKLIQDSTSTFNYFVHETDHWQALISHRTQQQNRRFFQQRLDQENKEMKSPVAIAPLWFFGLFLVAMAGLWLEPKL